VHVRPLSGQFYEKGEDPSFIHWKQIRTSNYQIIFPESYQEEAQRLANILEYAYNYVSFSLKNKPRKISVIIHNYSTRFNGFVAWAPKRMELYPTPPQDIYPHDALEQLALHELRHVVQVDKLHQGLTRILYYILGEMATGAISGMLPIWYLEGDAVATETALSRTGRGRLPAFEMKLRSLSLEKGEVYNYDKAYLGSYKDYVPNYYEYGYQMIAYSRQKYGNQWWDRSLKYVARNPYLINPIHFSLYSNLGLNKRRLYDATFRELASLWQENASSIQYSTFDTLNTRAEKVYTSYRFPQYLNDSIIIAEKFSLDKISRFIAIDRHGNEEVLHKPGFHDPVRLSVGKQWIVWSEIMPDARWSNRDYSVIKKFDLSTNRETTLTHRSRFFSPVISPDGSEIMVIENTIQNKENILFLDTENGEVIRSIPVPGKYHCMMPVWDQEQENIYLIVLGPKGKNLQKVNLQSKTWEFLSEPGYDDILNIAYHPEYLFYHSSHSGIDNIYAIDLASKTEYRITSSGNGAFDVAVSPDGKKLVFSDYTASGYNLAEMPINKSHFLKLDSVIRKRVSWDEALASQEAAVLESSDYPEKAYEVKPYRKISHLFQFHSWAPFYTDLEKIDLDNFQISPGIMLLSQNKLSTLISSISYTYKDNYHQLFSTVTYKGLVPAFDLSLNYGGAPLVISDSAGVSTSNISFTSRVYVPLNLTQNRFVRGIYPSFETEYRNLYIYDDEAGSFEKGLWTNRYRLYAYNYQKLAHRDIQPRWGQLFDISYSGNRFNGSDQGSSYYVKVGLYLPGLLTNHGIKVTGGMEKRLNTRRMFYYNALNMPRGYSPSLVVPLAEKFENFTGEYFLPLWYPDINISSILYFKRLRGSIFYDYSRGKMFNSETSSFNQSYSSYASTGGSLVVDLHFLRIRFPISLGVEYAYLPNLNLNRYSLIFNINVFGFNINH
jgi:hypothetical protein